MVGCSYFVMESKSNAVLFLFLIIVIASQNRPFMGVRFFTRARAKGVALPAKRYDNHIFLCGIPMGAR